MIEREGLEEGKGNLGPNCAMPHLVRSGTETRLKSVEKRGSKAQSPPLHPGKVPGVTQG